MSTSNVNDSSRDIIPAELTKEKEHRNYIRTEKVYRKKN